MVFLHVHKGCVRVCLAVAVPVTADMDVQIVAFQPFQPVIYGFNSLLQAGFTLASILVPSMNTADSSKEISPHRTKSLTI